MSNSPDTLNSLYYQTHAGEFFEQTVALEMDQLYRMFLEYIPADGKILDAGCGSGRDAKYFLDHGYKVEAFDSSPALAALATAHIAQDVDILRFQDLDCERKYHGIWACASLLHVPTNNMRDVFLRLFRALKAGGVLYASFKYGQGERNQIGRHFTDMNEDALASLLASGDDFREVKTWVSVDLRPGREDEKWLNTILLKEGN